MTQNQKYIKYLQSKMSNRYPYKLDDEKLGLKKKQEIIFKSQPRPMSAILQKN